MLKNTLCKVELTIAERWKIHEAVTWIYQRQGNRFFRR